jgi:hypothetical protein
MVKCDRKAGLSLRPTAQLGQPVGFIERLICIWQMRGLHKQEQELVWS